MTDPRPDDSLRSALFTDLYELTMAQVYMVEGMTGEAVFELFFRELPDCRGYIMAAGLDEVLSYLEHFRFTDEDLRYLKEREEFPGDFLQMLRDLRFSGDVWAMPEGTLVFPNEPLVQVRAPVVEAQLVETFILNQIHFQSIAATKAARVVTAAAGRAIVDFGSRRAHTADAALKVARCSYLAGAAGTSNVLAGKLYGVPTFGTMAHSYVQAHDDEAAAMAVFADVHPQTTLLVDTYDTLAGVQKVIDLARRQGQAFNVRAIRLDSGDLAQLAKGSRRMLDEAGLKEVKIVASSGLDEYKVAELLAAEAPIDGFGVGTNLAVSDDAPSLDMAYKLVEYADRPRMKLSSSKTIYPGGKQVFREVDGGEMIRDTIGHHDEELPGEPLLQQVMQDGKRLDAGRVTLEDARSRAEQQLALLPAKFKQFGKVDEPYPVNASPRVQQELDQLRTKLQREQ